MVNVAFLSTVAMNPLGLVCFKKSQARPIKWLEPNWALNPLQLRIEFDFEISFYRSTQFFVHPTILLKYLYLLLR
jgi:hypothetical protein